MFYYKVIILDSSNKTEFLKIKDDCHRHTQKKFLDKLSPSNSNPILIIYFKTNFKITSLFAIDIKLIIEQTTELVKDFPFENKFYIHFVNDNEIDNLTKSYGYDEDEDLVLTIPKSKVFGTKSAKSEKVAETLQQDPFFKGVKVGATNVFYIKVDFCTE